MEEIKKVYRKYKHLDKLLSDEKLAGNNFRLHIRYELWMAIKKEIEKEGE